MQNLVFLEFVWINIFFPFSLIDIKVVHILKLVLGTVKPQQTMAILTKMPFKKKKFEFDFLANQRDTRVTLDNVRGAASYHFH